MTFLFLTTNAQPLGLGGLKNKAKEKIKEKTAETQASTVESVKKNAANDIKAAANSNKLIFTNKEYASFAEAQSHGIKEVKDGDELWVYVKLDAPIEKYADAIRFTDRDGNLIEKKSLWIVIGAEGDSHSKYEKQELILVKASKNLEKDNSGNSGVLTKLDIDPSVTEFKLLLSKYLRGKSSHVMIRTVANGMIGRWNNEIRLARNFGNDAFVTAPLVCDVSNGMAMYVKAWKEYDKKISSGDIGDNPVPTPGKFVDAKLKAIITEKFKNKFGVPVSVNFGIDEWIVHGTANTGYTREMQGYAIYKKNGKCSYTIIIIRQTKTPYQNSWSDANYSFQQEDSPFECTK